MCIIDKEIKKPKGFTKENFTKYLKMNKNSKFIQEDVTECALAQYIASNFAKPNQSVRVSGDVTFSYCTSDGGTLKGGFFYLPNWADIFIKNFDNCEESVDGVLTGEQSLKLLK